VEKRVLLSVRDLRTHFHLRAGVVKAVNGVSFDLQQGSVLGVVGESGSGKSIVAKSILRTIRKPGRTHGNIYFHEEGKEPVDLAALDPMGKQIRAYRGAKISMIFQEPLNAFSPVHTIGDQIMECIILHRGMDKKSARREAIMLLDRVGISNPQKRVDEYPFQLSGGMRQRAMIAMALSFNPQLILADEPTTALDVSVQAQILKLLKDIQRDLGMSMIFITHDLAVIAQMADRVMVMYLGQVMEEGDVNEIFSNPKHPYTKKLLESVLDPRRTDYGEKLQTIEGAVPEPINLPDRCVFYERCGEVCGARCSSETPPVYEVGPGHRVRCFKAESNE
jgi:peptide/nickel transport system ATP-binding protein